jgi:hypothetical protein
MIPVRGFIVPSTWFTLGAGTPPGAMPPRGSGHGPSSWREKLVPPATPFMPHGAMSAIAVVSLPEVTSATNTRLPSGDTPMLPGLSPKSWISASRLAESPSPRLFASKTHTSARPSPSTWVSFTVSLGWF